MPAKTDLNVTPYFDDFDADNNFHQVLARPGHSIQARELTQLQSILKNQVERISDFVLQEGTMVIPGQLKIMTDFDYLKIENAYGGETINVSQYVGATITGQSSKVSAVVVHVETSTATDQSTFYLRYTGAGTDKTGDAASSPVLFTAGETLSASIAVTNGSTAYGANDVSAQVYTDSTGAAPTGKGVGATMTPGTYYLRGSFVEVAEQTITLGKYSIEDVNVRVGFTITETIVAAYEKRESLTRSSASAELIQAIYDALKLLDNGEARVAEPTPAGWVVNEWLKKAVLLSFILSNHIFYSRYSLYLISMLRLKILHKRSLR